MRRASLKVAENRPNKRIESKSGDRLAPSRAPGGVKTRLRAQVPANKKTGGLQEAAGIQSATANLLRAIS